MKLLKGIFAILLASQSVMAADAIEDRISNLEERSLLNIFELSGGSRIYLQQMEIKNGNNPYPTGPMDLWSDEKGGFWRIYGYLNADAKPYDDVKVYTRFAFSKYFNEDTFGSDGGIREPGVGTMLSRSRAYASSEVNIEKFYFDWSATENLVLSMGRLSTFDGPPFHFMTGDARMGTYPKMAYNVVLDGMAASYNLKNVMPTDHNLAVRVIYSPLSSVFSANYPATAARGDTGDGSYGPQDNAPHDLGGILLDYSTNKFGFAKTFNAIAFKQWIGKIPQWPDPGGQIRYDDATIDLSYMALHVDAEGLFNTGLSASLTYLESITKSEGTAWRDNDSSGSMDMGEQLGGFQTDGTDGENKGGALLLALRYQMNMGNKPWIGMEYVNGDKHHNFYDTAPHEMDNFYGVNGYGVNLYYTHPIKNTFTVTLGYKNRVQEWGGANPFVPTLVLNMPYGERAKLAEKEEFNTTYFLTNMTF